MLEEDLTNCPLLHIQGEQRNCPTEGGTTAADVDADTPTNRIIQESSSEPRGQLSQKARM